MEADKGAEDGIPFLLARVVCCPFVPRSIRIQETQANGQGLQAFRWALRGNGKLGSREAPGFPAWGPFSKFRAEEE
jgi:hypothetical protein